MLKQLKINDVEVEVSELGDHYDPQAMKVRLSEANFSGNSLAAVAIAAHEVGHAIQHKQQMPLFTWRGRLVMLAIGTEKLGVMALMAIPLVGSLLRIPHPMIGLLAVGIGSLLVGVIVQLITLPVETDASFNKALPLLIKGQYIDKKDEKAVRQILRAAAMTYVAATLASILNVWRWLAILRR
ncbi:MAG: zinc metallopeptidase [Alcanivorax sp.]|nr:zinc metallopeptidase [Alcanivorax sp.]